MTLIAVPVSTRTPYGRTSSAAEGGLLQRLIDAASPGVLDLPAGDYVMLNSLRLRSGIHLRGHGQVRLRRAKTVEARLTQITGYGHQELVVDDASAFTPGTGIAISDARSAGFGTLIATVIARESNTLFIDRPVERDLRPANHARIRNLFPIIAGYDVQQAGVEGVTVEGDASPAPLDGCRDAGIYLIACRDVRISRVEIAHYPGDAISFQQCIDTYIDRCYLHHNAGHGLHPGSGSVRYVMRANHVESNGGCGVFYCLRTSHSICAGNTIDANAAEGISIGERDTDHMIQDNTVRANAGAGIRFRPPVHAGGDRVVVSGNRVQDNAVKSGGPQVLVAEGTHDVVIRHNQITGDPASPLIVVGSSCKGVWIESNTDLSGGAIRSRTQSQSPTECGAAPDVGPATMGVNGARHLGIAALQTWTDRTQPQPQEQP